MLHYSRFRHLAIERAKPEPSQAQLAAIEALLGASLPSVFRDFLRVANGGYLEYVIDAPMADGTTEALSFCGIFSADDGKFCDETFLGEIRSGREYTKIPLGVLPFVDATEEWLDIGMPKWRDNPDLIQVVSEARHRLTTR